MKIPRNDTAFLAIALLLAAAPPQTARAALWKTEAQLTAEYGESVEISRIWGSRTFTYQVNDLKLEVQFQDGVAQSISYQHKERTKAFSPEEIESLLKLNSEGKEWHRKDEGTWELGAPSAKAYSDRIVTTTYSTDGKETAETEHRFEVVTVAFEAKEDARSLLPSLDRSRTGAEKRYQGILEFKDEEEQYRLAIVRDGDSVLEIPWAWPYSPGKAKLEPGQTYEVTLRDENPVDMDASVAFVSDRVHKSSSARVNDSEFFPLVRIKHAGELVYDESVCEVHKTPMQRTTAEISYGMYAPATKADAVCDKEYPHHADWIRGGCVLGDIQSATHYVCPQCVAATAKYKREHPDEGASPH